jgi:hypothetical protein
VLPAAAAPAGLLDLHVAELCADAEATAVEAAVQDDATADAGADGDDDQVRLAATGTELVLGPGRGVRVVLHHHRQAHPSGDRVAQRLVAPGQVRCDEDPRAVGVDEAGRPDARRPPPRGRAAARPRRSR